jgi:hypothetical protein
MAAVRIFLGGANHASSHGVEMNVTDKFSEVRSAFAEYRLMPALKDMPDPLISAVVILAVTGKHTLHNVSNGLGLPLQQQMSMVGHQAIGVKVKAGPVFLFSQ